MLLRENMHLNEFCEQVEKIRRHASLVAAVRLIILVYYRTLCERKLGVAGAVSDETGDSHRHFSAPDTAAAPAPLMQVVLAKLELIESHVE